MIEEIHKHTMVFTLDDVEEIVTCIIDCGLNIAEAKDYYYEFLKEKIAQSYEQ